MNILDTIIDSIRQQRSLNSESLHSVPSLKASEIEEFRNLVSAGVVNKIISETDEDISYLEIKRKDNPGDWAKYWLELEPLIPMVYYALSNYSYTLNLEYKVLKDEGLIEFLKEVTEYAEESVEEMLDIDSMLLGLGIGKFNFRFIEAKLDSFAKAFKTENDNTSMIAGSSFISFLMDNEEFTSKSVLYYIVKKVERENGVKFLLDFLVDQYNYTQGITVVNEEIQELIQCTSQIYVNRNLLKTFGGITSKTLKYPFYRPCEKSLDAMTQVMVGFFSNEVKSVM